MTGWNLKLEDSDKINSRLKQLLEDFKPHSSDERDYSFFEVVRELIVSTVTSYQHLRRGYVDTDNPLLAWACRNLLELRVFTKYSLASGTNAFLFAGDRLIDARDIAKALIDLERFYGPGTDTPLLDEWLDAIEKQMTAEGVNAAGPLRTPDVAKQVGLYDEYRSMNKVCSKLLHRTGWSVIAMKVGTADFPHIRDTIFGCGVGYLSCIYSEILDYKAVHGLKPKP